MLRRLQRFLKSVGYTVVGALAVGLLKILRLFDPDKLADFAGWTMRMIGPWLPENKIGRDNLMSAFPEKSAAEIDRILRGVWDNSAAWARNLLISTACGIGIRPIPTAMGASKSRASKLIVT